MTIRCTAKAKARGNPAYQYLFRSKQGNEYIHRKSGGIIGLSQPLNSQSANIRAQLIDLFNDVIMIKRVAPDHTHISYRLHDLENTVRQKNFDTRLIGFLPDTAKALVEWLEEIENIYFDEHTSYIRRQ